MAKLPSEFYTRDDVVTIARELLGKVLYTNIEGEVTAGIITETEAYEGITDKASHAYGGKRTNRTEIMYASGGVSYVYLCYGIHYLFNVVTNVKDIPHAVLIRGVQPYEGVDTILKRRKANQLTSQLTIGPGKVSCALAINKAHNGLNLEGNTVWIEDKGIIIKNEAIFASKRIGIDYAQEDADLPYRFETAL